MSQSTRTDQVLVTAVLAGDAQALGALYRQLEPILRLYVLARVSNPADAEEIIQDSLISFLDALPLFSFRSSLWTFLCSITRHEIADYYRRQYAKRVVRSVPLINSLYDQKLYSSNQSSRDLQHMIDAVYALLTPKHRNILRYKYEDDLSIKQIALKMELTVKATESLLYRARTAFQQSYRELYGEPEFAILSDELFNR